MKTVWILLFTIGTAGPDRGADSHYTIPIQYSSLEVCKQARDEILRDAANRVGWANPRAKCVKTLAEK
jgi:hypothetical protein